MTTTDDKVNFDQCKTDHLIQLDVDAIMKESKKKTEDTHTESLHDFGDLRKRKVCKSTNRDLNSSQIV